MGQYYRAVILSEEEHGAEILASYEANKHDSNGAKLTEHSWIGNYFVYTIEALLCEYGNYNRHRLVWAGDYADREEGKKSNLYFLSEAYLTQGKVVRLIPEYHFLVNHSKRVLVDKFKSLPGQDGWRIHPLPLLTAEGNGRGSGDYHPRSAEEEALIGSWARDIISVERQIPDGYQEIVPPFLE